MLSLLQVRHVYSLQIIFGCLAADYWHNKLLWVERGGSTINEMPLYFKGSVSSKVVFGALSKTVSKESVSVYLRSLSNHPSTHPSTCLVSHIN